MAGPKFGVIGGSEIGRAKVREEIIQSSKDHIASLTKEEREGLASCEIPKTPLEIRLIELANQETSRLMTELGLESFDIPINNLHIVQSDIYSKICRNNNPATAYATKQSAYFNEKYSSGLPVIFWLNLLHELTHMKSSFVVAIQEEDNKMIKTPYREGVTAHASLKESLSGNYHAHFSGLHEGIVAEAEKRMAKKIFDLAELAGEKDWIGSEEATDLARKLAKKLEVDVDDIVWARINKERGEVEHAVYSYPKQRSVLEYVCAEIQKQFPEKFHDRDEVFKEFLRANFTGNLLTIGRLVEQTFGDGGFRLLGNMDGSRQSGVLHLEALKKARTNKNRDARSDES